MQGDKDKGQGVSIGQSPEESQVTFVAARIFRPSGRRSEALSTLISDSAASLVNSVLRCSWYLVTRCLSEIRAVHEGRGGATVRFWRSHAAARGTPLRSTPLHSVPRVATAPAYYVGLCSSLRCERPRLDSTRLESRVYVGEESLGRHADNDNPRYASVALSGDRYFIVSIPTLTLFAMERRVAGDRDRGTRAILPYILRLC